MSVKAMAWAWEQDTTPNETLVLLSLADHANQDFECWPKTKTLEKKTKLTQRSIFRLLKALEEKNIIKRCKQFDQRGSKIQNKYLILHPDVPCTNVSTHMTQCHDPSDTVTPPLLTQCHIYNRKNHHKEPSIESGKPSKKDLVSEIFEYWQEVLNHHGSKLDQNRSTHIERVFKLGYDKFDCFLAIRGCKASKWHMGDNPQNKKYDDLGLIFRNAEKIEKFIKSSGVLIPKEAKHPKTAFKACFEEEPAGILFVIKERIKAKFDGDWNKFAALPGNKQWIAFESIYKHSMAQVMPV